MKAVGKHQEAIGDNIKGKKGISKDGSEKSNGYGDDSVINWEDCANVQEEIIHDEGGDYYIIKHP